MRHVLCASLAVTFLATGCGSAVKMSRVRDDYAAVDQQRTKRLVVVTSPSPNRDPLLGELWAVLARRYVNQNRDFIAKESRVEEGRFEPRSACTDGIEGVLHLEPREATLKEKGAEVGVFAQLVRCPEGEEIWAAESGGSWGSDSDLFASQRAQYESELGQEIGPWVVPSFQLLKATLETLPNPVLDDEDVIEKIELGE